MNVQGGGQLLWLKARFYGGSAGSLVGILLMTGVHVVVGTILFVVLGLIALEAIAEIILDAFLAPKPEVKSKPLAVSEQHIQLRDKIVASLETAKQCLQPAGSRGYADGYSMYFTETDKVILCVLQLETGSGHDTKTGCKFSYNLERKYCIHKYGNFAVTTINDAEMIRRTEQGTVINEDWLQPGDHEDWAELPENTASHIELTELSDYLIALNELA